MRLVFISDTHGMHRRMKHKVPKGDVLIHCGDMTGHGTLGQTSDIAAWLGDQPHKHKIAIAGNHDAACEEVPGTATMFFRECGVTYLCDEAIELDGVKFWGAPWTPNFCNWHFMPDRGSAALKAHWDLIPENTQVLITHGPPAGILDRYIDSRYIERAGQESVGCELLAKRVDELKVLKVHAFGHIHEGYGWIEEVRPEPKNHFDPYTSAGAQTVRFVNAAICNRDYDPVNRPQVVDL